MTTALVILGDQLFPQIHGQANESPIFMKEDWGLCTNVRHHKQKLVLFLSAMRHHANELKSQGRALHYETLEGRNNDTYHESLGAWLAAASIKAIQMVEPADGSFRAATDRWATRAEVTIEYLPNQGFITSDADWSEYRRQFKRLHMADFYRYQRLRLNLLVNGDGSPIGGKWSFDGENRKPLPKGTQTPPIPSPASTPHIEMVKALVQNQFPDHPGQVEHFSWAVTRRQALHLLDDFVQNRLQNFGPFEDAVSKDHSVLWHSQLSYLLNMGLLTPSEVLQSVVEAPNIPLASREGFIRQVVGWREFIYHVDREYRSQNIRLSNSLQNTRILSSKWWTGETGFLPLDHCIGKALKTGYLHHIERLMVIGSAMLMCDVDPNEVYRWFMEMFIDSSEWVMRPNVYGMSQFADGGLFATKPYVSGSAYLRKMTDFPRGPWCDAWDALYWRFIGRNRERFIRNPRMSMMVRQWENMPLAKRAGYDQLGNQVVDSLTLTP